MRFLKKNGLVELKIENGKWEKESEERENSAG